MKQHDSKSFLEITNNTKMSRLSFKSKNLDTRKEHVCMKIMKHIDITFQESNMIGNEIVLWGK